MAAPTVPARPSGLKIWMMAARPPTLPAAVVPVLVGSAVAWRLGGFQLLPFLAALLAALLIQIGANFANDYFDFQKGADTDARLGPPRVTQQGLIAPAQVRNAMILAFALAALLGCYLAWVGGWPIIAIGVLSIAAGVLYTGGPWPFGYHGLGDLFTFVFFGIVAVVGTAFLHLGRITPAAVFFALPVALLVTAILVVNNLRDADTDRAAKKYTLAVLFGKPFVRGEYVTLVLGAYLLLPLAIVLGYASIWVLLPLITLPLALPQLQLVLREQGRPLNAALRGTARLHMVFGALLTLGLLLG